MLAEHPLHAGVGNQSGRGRRKPNLGAMPDYSPRCMVLSSGEDVPKTRSLRGRVVLVPIETGSVDMSALSEAQKLARGVPFVQTWRTISGGWRRKWMTLKALCVRR
jgi:hypothetical protein